MDISSADHIKYTGISLGLGLHIHMFLSHLNVNSPNEPFMWRQAPKCLWDNWWGHIVPKGFIILITQLQRLDVCYGQNNRTPHGILLQYITVMRYTVMHQNIIYCHQPHGKEHSLRVIPCSVNGKLYEAFLSQIIQNLPLCNGNIFPIIDRLFMVFHPK